MPDCHRQILQKGTSTIEDKELQRNRKIIVDELHETKESTWRRQWHPTPALLPGKSHGLRSLEGCSPWGHKELDMTQRLSTIKIWFQIIILW